MMLSASEDTMDTDGMRSGLTSVLIVRFNVTTLSQPAALVPVQVAVLLDEVYVVPCHNKLPQALIVSVEEVGCLIVRFNVTTLSQPAALVPVQVAVLLEDR